MPDTEQSSELSALEALLNSKEPAVLDAIQSLREALAQQEAATAEREALYRELIHRVKNHLQIMTSLLALQARDPALSARDLGEQMKGRLQTLAAIYRGMERAEAGARIEARTFVEEVCCPYAAHGVNVNAAVEPPDLTLTSKQAAPIGLLMNEAVRHSSERLIQGHGGRVQVSFRRLEPGRLRLEIADDGVERGSAEPGSAPHGPDLMKMFAKQLQGELEQSDRPDGGAMVAAEFPEAAG